MSQYNEVFKKNRNGIDWYKPQQKGNCLHHYVDVLYVAIDDKLLLLLINIMILKDDVIASKHVFYGTPNIQNILTHCGLVTSYSDRDLGQHWFM